MDEVEEIQSKLGIVGRREELKAALAAVRAKRHLLIEGPVGVGKTIIALAVAKHLNRPFYRVDGDERYTEQKLTGWFDPPITLKKGYVKEAFIAGPLTMAMESGGVLFINELNRMPEAVQNVLLPAMDELQIDVPKIGKIQAKHGFVIIATQNPSEFVATSPLSEALRDRFELITLDYQTEEEEIQIAKKNTGIDDDDLIRLAVLIGRATRKHPDIRRGVSVRAAMSVASLTLQLGRSMDAVRKACHMALPTRIDLAEDAKKPVRDIIEEILNKVLEKSSFKQLESRAASQDSVNETKHSTIVIPDNLMENLSQFIKFKGVERRELGWLLAKEYPEVKWKVDENLRKTIKQIAIKAILHRALRMIGPTKRSAKLRREQYRFGKDEIDLDSTFEQTLGRKDYRLEDIIVETREKKRVSCALIVDTSLSMTGEKLAVAAVGTAVLALKLKNDNYSLVTFESNAKLLKGIAQKKDVESVISDLLETPAKGYTNMEDGLKTGLDELNKARTRERFGVIITDGNCSIGYDPQKVAAKYPKLYVIMTEGPESNQELCRDLARLGRGKMYKVKDYDRIPRVLYNLLRNIY